MRPQTGGGSAQRRAVKTQVKHLSSSFSPARHGMASRGGRQAELAGRERCEWFARSGLGTSPWRAASRGADRLEEDYKGSEITSCVPAQAARERRSGAGRGVISGGAGRRGGSIMLLVQ